MTCTEAAERLRSIKSASVVRVTRLDELRESCKIETAEQFRKAEKHLAMLQSAHPSGYRVNLPLPTWYRFESETVEPLTAAPAPGTHTRSVLAELVGIPHAEVDRLQTKGIVRENWSVLKHYLPL